MIVALNMKPRNRQSGVVLIITMVLLIMITLLAMTAIRSSTTELQIAGNAQLRKELAHAAQEGVEVRINSMTDFNNVIAGVAVGTATYTLQGNRYQVKVSEPVCVKSVPEGGTSLVNAGVSASETTYWRVQSTVEDATNGAVLTSSQGVKMRMPLGSCP